MSTAADTPTVGECRGAADASRIDDCCDTMSADARRMLQESIDAAEDASSIDSWHR